jgi:CBS domain-containing protein
MDSHYGFIVLLDNPGGKILGLVTLHDLLRAQLTLGNPNGGDASA